MDFRIGFRQIPPFFAKMMQRNNPGPETLPGFVELYLLIKIESSGASVYTLLRGLSAEASDRDDHTLGATMGF